MFIRLRSWLWSGFVFLYPWVFLIGTAQSPYNSNLVHYLFTVGTVLLWVLINYQRLRIPTTSDLKTLIKHKPAFFALIFGIWVLLSSLFAPDPAISLTGNLTTLRESALFLTLLSIVFVTAYFDYFNGILRVGVVYRAVVFTAIAFVFAAFLELYRGTGFFYQTTNPYPLVVFPGPGHLAGFLGMALGVLGGIASSWSWLAILILAFGLGLTFNRTAVGASAISFIVNLASPWTRRILLILILLVSVLSGWQSVEYFAQQGRRDIAKITTLEDRYAYWRIALKGIALRPIFGWGGGQFHTHLGEVADINDLKVYLFSPRGARESRILYMNGNFFTVEYPDGRMENRYVIDWAPHNLFLGVALSWGVVGLVIYLLLLAPALPPAFHGNPAALGVLAYHLFLLLWPPSTEALGVLWVLWAIAGASYVSGYKARS